METVILKFICAHQGAVNTDDLMCELGSGDATIEIINNADKLVSCRPYGQAKVVARARLRLCRSNDCLGSCRGLHLCKKFFFTGSCPFTRTRTGCKFSHDLESAHNVEVLKVHGLECLSRAELCTLLLQSDLSLLPQICHDYNNGGGESGLCKEGFDCKRLHICERFLNRDCSCFKAHDFNAPQPLKNLQEKRVPDELIDSLKSVYANILALKYADRKGDGGNRQQQPENSFTGEYRGRGRGGFRGNRGNGANRGNRANRGRRGYGGNQGNLSRTSSTSDILDDIDGLGISEDRLNKELQQNPDDISAAAKDCNVSSNDDPNRKQKPNKSTTDVPGAVKDVDGPNRRQRHVRDKTEICMYFIKGHCKHEEKCYKAHDKMPYRWEVREDDQWIPLPDNEKIEKDYCEPENTYSTSTPPVHFDTMTRQSKTVRRLSTINSLREPDFIHTTQWLWYWEDEFGKWNVYASSTGGHKVADMDSSKLEQRFLDNDKDVVEFTAGSQSYSLSFQDMLQTNKNYGTKRLVRRRPQFVSAADVRTKKPNKKPPSNFTAVPDHWDKTQILATGFKRIPLQRTSAEYKEIETLFCNTMRGFDIQKIERIQNKSLWEVFQWQKNQMKINNHGITVPERKLFHGTDAKFVDVICHTNFDWRICGTHGTAYGQGSYFARDAKYSHNYTGDSEVKSLFISRVLVGDYTRGSSDYRRPPSKDGGDINFYDTCVDDVLNPSIFVVFKELQIYPEYLLQYKATHPLVNIYGTASAPAPAPAPKPKIAPKPSVSVQQPSVSPYRPSASVQSSTTTSAYRPSTSSYSSGTSGYASSASRSAAFASSASSYQSTTSAYRPSTSSHSSSSSAYTSGASSYQPSTPSYQYKSSTTASRYTTSPPLSTPSPPPKKSDSCVIA